MMQPKARKQTSPTTELAGTTKSTETNTPKNQTELVKILRQLAGDVASGNRKGLRPWAERAHALAWGVRPDWEPRTLTMPNGTVVTTGHFREVAGETKDRMIGYLDAAASMATKLIHWSKLRTDDPSPVTPESLNCLADLMASVWGILETRGGRPQDGAAAGLPRHEQGDAGDSKRTPKRGGSKRRSDPQADERLARDYRSSGHTMKDFAALKGMTLVKLKLCLDRDRKRRK